MLGRAKNQAISADDSTPCEADAEDPDHSTQYSGEPATSPQNGRRFAEDEGVPTIAAQLSSDSATGSQQTRDSTVGVEGSSAPSIADVVSSAAAGSDAEIDNSMFKELLSDMLRRQNELRHHTDILPHDDKWLAEFRAMCARSLAWYDDLPDWFRSRIGQIGRNSRIVMGTSELRVGDGLCQSDL